MLTSDNQRFFVSLSMKYIKGQDRAQIQLFPVSLDQSIDADNEVRLLDFFVDSLSIKDFGFKVDFKTLISKIKTHLYSISICFKTSQTKLEALLIDISYFLKNETQSSKFLIFNLT